VEQGVGGSREGDFGETDEVHDRNKSSRGYLENWDEGLLARCPEHKLISDGHSARSGRGAPLFLATNL
jgi:hypothetical protein